jgi:hypothetical protein
MEYIFNICGFITCTLLQVYYNTQVKEDEMNRACSTNGRGEECIWDTGGKARRKDTARKTKT